MRTLIVHNPQSGFDSDHIYEFQRSLLEAGDECVFRVLTNNPDQDKDRLYDAEDYDVVVLSGGDGSVAHMLYELRNRQVTTCVFPSGTANLIAGNIGNATEPAALAKACTTGSVFTADLGEISWTDTQGKAHTEGFALMSGTGFDAQLMHDAMPAKRLFGEAAYFAAVLNNLKPKVYHLTITVDGVPHEHEGISCIVANSATMQGEIEIIPDCVMNDGKLDVIVLETTDAAQLLGPLFAGIIDPRGKDVTRPRIVSYRGEHIQVTSDHAMKIEVDGDAFEDETTSWEARIIPGCCHIVTDSLSRYAPRSA